MDGQANAIEIARTEVLGLSITDEYRVGSPAEAIDANAALKKVKVLGKMLEEAKSSEVKPLNDQVRLVRERYREAEGILMQAESTLKYALMEFTRAEDKRIADERRVQIEAAAREKARLEIEARKEREKAEAKADALRAKGQDEKADAIVAVADSSARAKEAVAQMVAAPVSAPDKTTLEGFSTREVWVGKVTNLHQFLASLSNSQYDLNDLVTVNQAGINRLAKSLKGNMDKALPGAIAWPEQQAASRSK